MQNPNKCDEHTDDFKHFEPDIGGLENNSILELRFVRKREKGG